MCGSDHHDHDDHDDHHEALHAHPREAGGDAVDPIVLEPVDEIVITTLVDNSYDGLLGDMEPARRTGMGGPPRVKAEQFEGGTTLTGLVAQHGFSTLATAGPPSNPSSNRPSQLSANLLPN
jgi:7,8-dihydropterin-6-yl-methyl-4-(beta-D-ribofuranosyl)aminobenzene 5'-phosphate synthase